MPAMVRRTWTLGVSPVNQSGLDLPWVGQVVYLTTHRILDSMDP